MVGQRRKPRLNMPNRKTREAKAMVQQRRDYRAVVVIPTIHHLMDDATSILGSEMAGLMHHARDGRALTNKDSLKVARYVHAITELAREERIQARVQNPELNGLTDDELVREMLRHPDFKAKVVELLETAA